MNRLVMVSNRLDVSPGDRAPGGLAVSLAATLRATGGLWFGWSGQVTPNAQGAQDAQGLRQQTLGRVDYALVDLSPEEYLHYYQGFSNGILWPLCHGLPATSCPDASAYRVYQQVNARYAELLGRLLAPTDLVWVHDYHLLPLGTHLRAAGCRHRVGFFLHVPCPAFQELPQGRELLTAMLAYDLIGFQTTEDLVTFQTAARWNWGATAVDAEGSLLVEGRRIALGVFPVGIDVAAVSAAAQGLTPTQAAAWWPGGKTTPRLVGVDRLDVSKGLPLRLNAYRELLAARPGNAALPHYLQFITPSRSDLLANQLLQRDIQSAAAAINSPHEGTGSSPLGCVFEALPQNQLMTLLASADVGLVTPLKDGMNLLAKEFIAAQPSSNPGVLVLSKHAGAARELESALLVEPRDLRAVALAMATAIDMPLIERQERHQALLAALKRHEVSHWHTAFVERLRESQPR